ncbi:MAG TPA: FUN14 domain-containing protein [Nitrososphaeraceae archaeon]|nr:FUN14 domain-containing protein [Nitrososphaeraceae archaeon]
MMLENLIPTITSIGGSFVAGIMLGYFLKKIIKILIFIAGGIVALLLYLKQQQVISVDAEKMEASSSFIFNSVASSFDTMTQTGDMTTLGIPLTGGLSAGLAIGLMKG